VRAGRSVLRHASAATVVVASPAALVRRRWKEALRGAFAVREAVARSEVELALTGVRPAVLLLDLALPKLDGIDGVVALQKLSPPTRVVVLTATPNDTEGLAALMAGARGYSHRELDPALTGKAVEVVQKGEIWASRTLTSQLIAELVRLAAAAGGMRDRSRAAARLHGLTPRQREIAALVGSGAANKEIAAKLAVSERTVKAHLTGIFRRLGICDRLRLALLVNEQDTGPSSLEAFPHH
jgi:two-component system nitrate/nitrite response regulator NarL